MLTIADNIYLIVKYSEHTITDLPDDKKFDPILISDYFL